MEVLDAHNWISCALDLARLPPVGSRVVYFPQGHFEQWGEHLAPPPDGHGPSFLCNVASLEVVTGPHAPYAVVSLTPVPQPQDEVLPPAPPVLHTPAPTQFVYNTKVVSQTDVKKTGKLQQIKPSVGIPKSIAEDVLPNLVSHLRMVDIKGSGWTFELAQPGAGGVHQLREGWRDFANEKNASAQDNLFVLCGADGRMIIELRKPANAEEAAPPVDLQEEVAQAASLAAQGETFSTTYYPHRGLGKYFVQQGEVEMAMDVAWAPGNVSQRKDELLHTSDSERCIHPAKGVVRAVRDSRWHGLEIEWADGTASTASAWELDVDGDSPPRKKPKTTRLFGADLRAAGQNLQA